MNIKELTGMGMGEVERALTEAKAELEQYEKGPWIKNDWPIFRPKKNIIRAWARGQLNKEGRP